MKRYAKLLQMRQGRGQALLVYTFWRALFICTLCLSLSGGALAITTPSSTLQVSIDEVLVYLQKPAYANLATRPPLRAAIEERIRMVFDFDEFSKRAVGVYWKRFTPEQKENLSEAFAQLLIVTYLDKVNGYNGEKIAYIGEVLSKKGNRAEVRTLLALANAKTIPIAYRMVLKNSQWAVYDVIIENISLIKNYRSQFGSLLQKETPEALIIKIINRTVALKAEAKE